MVCDEIITSDHYRLVFMSLNVLCDIFHSLYQPSKTSLINYPFTPTSKEVPDSTIFNKLLNNMAHWKTGVLRSVEMALYHLEILCLLIIAHLIFSGSSFDFTIATKEQGITSGFLKHQSHHSLASFLSCDH